VIVVKFGGNTGLDPVAICPGIAALVAHGERLVVLHGGSAEVDRLGKRLGVPQRRLRTPSGTSSRYTDPATLEVLTMAMAGLIKPRLLAALYRQGVRAIGLTGIDAGIIRAHRSLTHKAEVDGRQVLIRDDMTGRITEVASGPLNALLDLGLTPVLSPPALAQDGAPVNVDADRAAAAVAVALGADRLVFLTNIAGVLSDLGDEGSRLDRCFVAPDTGRPVDMEVGGGMAVKLKAAAAALRGGVADVMIADGRPPDALRRALDGAGTRIQAAVLVEPVGGHHD
jgi:acetylglutamate/LysW-gamma-L-alpha-aminoadipate kinase